MSRLLDEEEISRQIESLDGWSRKAAEITTTYELADFAGALDFVNRVGQAAEDMDHHPDIDIRWNKVTLVLSTHSEGGLTQLDIELAHRISEAAGPR